MLVSAYALEYFHFVLGWGPYAHFDAIEESRLNPNSAPANGFVVHETQFQPDFVTVPLGHNSSLQLNDMEAGRM